MGTELTNIGTKEQYSTYLDSIFPESKIKDIVYHGSKEKFDEVDINKSKYKKGFYFAKDKSIAEGYGKAISLIVNSKNINIQPFAHFGYSVDSKKEIETFLNKLKNLKKEKNLEDSLALQLIDVTEEIVFFATCKRVEAPFAVAILPEVSKNNKILGRILDVPDCQISGVCA